MPNAKANQKNEKVIYGQDTDLDWVLRYMFATLALKPQHNLLGCLGLVWEKDGSMLWGFALINFYYRFEKSYKLSHYKKHETIDNSKEEENARERVFTFLWKTGFVCPP